MDQYTKNNFYMGNTTQYFTPNNSYEKSMSGFGGSIKSIINHPYLVGVLLIYIPLLAICIIGFKRDLKLGFTSLVLMVAIGLLVYNKVYKLGERQHYFLLVVLIIILFSFMVYFIINVRVKVFNHSYIKFYNKTTYKNKNGVPLSFYGIGGGRSNNEILLDLMKGSQYGFALKEDLPLDLGQEGTYSFWLKVCPINFNKLNTKWRTVWYRGDDSGGKGESMFKMKTPGVYLAPNTNKLIITIACENGPDEGNAITVDDIPLNEWFCVSLTIDGRSMDCYINGLLEYSISLTGSPLMMNSNIVKGKNGFSGLLAFFRYNSGAMLPGQIFDMYEREKATLEDSVFNLESCQVES